MERWRLSSGNFAGVGAGTLLWTPGLTNVAVAVPPIRLGCGNVHRLCFALLRLRRSSQYDYQDAGLVANTGRILMTAQIPRP